MSARLALGPVFFNWQADAWRDFYFRIADEAPVDIVYVGEVVCSKRLPFVAPHLESVTQRLQRAGKEVALSSLALIANEREAATMRELCSGDTLVEANDMGLTRQLAGRPHVLGPFVNIYNESTLAYFARNGAIRACLPPELPATSIERIAGAAAIELETLVFGRLPLAISARCFHARVHDLHKDACQFACDRDPNGLAVETLDDEPFLAINGTQVLSHACYALLGELGWLSRAGIEVFRLSPMAVEMPTVARIFRDVADGQLDPDEAMSMLSEAAPDFIFANGFIHGAEGRVFSRVALPSVE